MLSLPPHAFAQCTRTPLSLPLLKGGYSRGSGYLFTGHMVSAVTSIMQGKDNFKIVAFITDVLSGISFTLFINQCQ